jgi:hypothetical protein
MSARITTVALPVGAGAGAEFKPYGSRTPILTLTVARTLVTLTLPERVRVEHVAFARVLAAQAAAYAIEVERIYRGVWPGRRAA